MLRFQPNNHGGGNKASRFLQVGINVEGGRKGVIWIPEGRNGSGWRRFANELRLFLSSKEKGLDLEVSKIPPSVGVRTGRSYAEVTRAALGPEVRFMPIPQSSSPLDVFPFLGKGCEGAEKRKAVDCFELELPVSKSQKAVGISSVVATTELSKKMMEGFFVICWLMKLLGFSQTDLVRVFDGLGAGPLGGMQVKPNSVMGLDLVSDPGLELDPCVDIVLGLDMIPGSDMALGSDMDSAEKLGPGLDPILLLDPVLSPDLAMVSGTVLDQPATKPSSFASLHSMRVSNGSSDVPETTLATQMSLPPMGFLLGYGRAELGLSVQDTSRGSGIHGELVSATAVRGDRASDFQLGSLVHAGNLPSDPFTSALTSSANSSEIQVSPVPFPSPTFTSAAIVDSGLNKSQKWLIEYFREVVKGNVTHMAIFKDLEESFRKACKEDHEGLFFEEDRDLVATKEELERVLGGHWLGVGDDAAQRKNSNPMRGFLRRGFLIPSPTEKKKSHSSSRVAVKKDREDGFLFLFLRRSANNPGLFLGRVKVRIEAFEGGADDVVERRVPSPAHGVVGGRVVVVAAAAAEGEGVGRGGVEWSSGWKFGD
ncbi:hypothetical protein FH972_009348 [Carpinus fangiana]|uniref:Uncharacterized protein n=1 Tax=Carpinus fangiana TaxID=176857 RepID=A0A5N6R1P1_9ROSI|nr:hypothetical protein FH972_009348 [Carpinus fangiana]